MNQKNLETKLSTDYVLKQFPNFKDFSFCIEGNTVNPSLFFNLLDYGVEGYDISEIKKAILRVKQDYGEAFRKLASED